MADTTFEALVVTKTEDKQYRREIQARSLQDLPQGEVLVRVRYSSPD